MSRRFPSLLASPAVPNQRRCRICRCFTLLELLVVVVIIATLVLTGNHLLGKAQAGALRNACQKNLFAIGKLTAQYESDSLFGRTPLAGAHTAYDRNETTLDPFLCLRAAGLLPETTLLSCPAGNGPILFGNDNPRSVSALAAARRAADRISQQGQSASNYLFTRAYQKDSAPNRVIAADAAAAEGGFSPNHGDRPGAVRSGANALKKDGAVLFSGPDYRPSGVEPRSAEAAAANLWDNAALPPAAAPETAARGTVIGHY